MKSTTGPKSDKIGCLYCIQNSDACSVLQISETPLAAEASSIIDVVVGRRFICCNSIRFEKGVYNYFCCKVRTFWEAHKFWKNLPYGFDVYLVNQLICQNHKEDFFKGPGAKNDTTESPGCFNQILTFESRKWSPVATF